MNLETRIEQPLWAAIQSSIEARNFSNAILDSIHYLSDVIRERSGLEGDGVALVGAAFGGNSPKLKVNRLQTESEQNMQRGVEALLRGIYQAIRNPRSHGPYQDDERSATAIILFVDHLVRIVDQSRTPFTMATFVAKVFDRAFVPKVEYAELLAKEVPETRRLAVVRELFVRRSEGDRSNTAGFIRVMLDKLKPEEVSEVYEFISEELAVTDDDDTIILVLHAFRGDVWHRLSEVARMRIEHKLIASVKTGRYKQQTGKCLGGGLGTWGTRIVSQFLLRDDLWRAVAELLRGTKMESDYAFVFMMPHIEQCFPKPPYYIIDVVLEGLKNGDQRFKAIVDKWALTTDVDEKLDFIPKPIDDPWRKPFVKAASTFVAAPEEISDDEIPF
jgi:uncharacterized protein (TIGR02391 family)